MQQGMTLQLASSASIYGCAQAPHLPGTKLLMHSCTVLHVCSSCPLSGSCDLHSGCIHRPHMRRIQDMYPSCSHHVMTAATACQIPPMVGNIMDSTCCHYLSLAFMCHAGQLPFKTHARGRWVYFLHETNNTGAMLSHSSYAHQKKCSSFSYFSRNMRRPPSFEKVAWPGNSTRSSSGSGFSSVLHCLTPQAKCTRPSWSYKQSPCPGQCHMFMSMWRRQACEGFGPHPQHLQHSLP